MNRGIDESIKRSTKSSMYEFNGRGMCKPHTTKYRNRSTPRTTKTSMHVFNPFTTGNPFLGTKLLGFSVWRGSGALKGLILGVGRSGTFFFRKCLQSLPYPLFLGFPVNGICLDHKRL